MSWSFYVLHKQKIMGLFLTTQSNHHLTSCHLTQTMHQRVIPLMLITQSLSLRLGTKARSFLCGVSFSFNPFLLLKSFSGVNNFFLFFFKFFLISQISNLNLCILVEEMKIGSLQSFLCTRELLFVLFEGSFNLFCLLIRLTHSLLLDHLLVSSQHSVIFVLEQVIILFQMLQYPSLDILTVGHGIQ